MKRNRPFNVHKVHKQAMRCVYIGVSAASLGVVIGVLTNWMLLALLCVVGGVVVAFAGWFHSVDQIDCPHCGGTLCDSGFRMPGRLPTHCPHCGKVI